VLQWGQRDLRPLLEPFMNTARSLRRFAGSLAALALVTTAVGCSGAASEDGADAPGATSSAQTSARPPQFVLLAFDGSLNLDFWEESRAFAKTSGA
jgi:hypothetical protein